MRILLLVGFVLLAGCANAPQPRPVVGLEEPVVAEVPLPPFDLADCLSTEATFPIPDQEPMPSGVRPAASSQVGPLQQALFWALTCTAQGETAPSTMLLALFDVEVDPEYDGEGDEHWVAAIAVDSPALLDWFAAAGHPIEPQAVTHTHTSAAGTTQAHFEVDGITVDSLTVDAAPQAELARRLLFGDADRVVGAVDLVASEHGSGTGAATLSFLDTVPPLALTGPASAGPVGRAGLQWVSLR